MIGYVAAGMVLLLVASNGLTWYYTTERAERELNAFKATVAATAKVKEAENARIQTQANAAAASAGAAAVIAEGRIWAAEGERRDALARLGGVVRDLADARRVLSARGSGNGPARDTAASLRVDPGHSGADPAGRLAACQADLTVLTDTLSVNKVYHELALSTRAEVIRLYNEVRREYNEHQ